MPTYPNIGYSESRHSRAPILTYYEPLVEASGEYHPGKWADELMQDALKKEYTPRFDFDQMISILTDSGVLRHDPSAVGTIRLNTSPESVEAAIGSGRGAPISRVIRHESAHSLLWPFLTKIQENAGLTPEEERQVQESLGGRYKAYEQLFSRPEGKRYMLSEALAWPMGSRSPLKEPLGFTSRVLDQVPPTARDRYLGMLTLEDLGRMVEPEPPKQKEEWAPPPRWSIEWIKK